MNLATTDLPATATVDVGLVGFVFLVTLVAATVASFVHVWWVERRAARRGAATFTPTERRRVDQAAEIRRAREEWAS